MISPLQDAAQVAPQDSTTAGLPTVYDSVWTNPDVLPVSSPLEQVMLQQDKLFVVLAVVLIIWLGLAYFILRTDRKLDKLERSVEEGIPEEPDDL